MLLHPLPLFRPYDSPSRGPERWPVDLDLPLRALYADGRFRRPLPVDVGGDAEVGQRDAVRRVWVVRRAWEGQEDRGHFIGAGVWIFGHGGENGGRGALI